MRDKIVLKLQPGLIRGYENFNREYGKFRRILLEKQIDLKCNFFGRELMS